jgi:hypothetical protein
MDAMNCGPQLEVLAAVRLSNNGHARMASRRPLAKTVLRCRRPPVPDRMSNGSVNTLAARRSRTRFAVHALLGASRLAVSLRRPAHRNR